MKKKGGFFSVVTVLVLGSTGLDYVSGSEPDADGCLFKIGIPDTRTAEFGLTGPGEGYKVYLQKYKRPYIHPARKDTWGGGQAHTFTICFACDKEQDQQLFLVIGLAGGSPSERSMVVVSVNETVLPAKLAPSGNPGLAFNPTGIGKSETMIFSIPTGQIRKGENMISIRLDDQSWIIYDYVALRNKAGPLPIMAPPERNLLAEFRKGPMSGINEIVFAVRRLGEDPHWYANFGYTLDHSRWRTYLDGGRLCRLNLNTGKVTTLLDDPGGGVRDPQLDYDARKILFSYRKGGSPHYHLCEIGVDGSGLRQLTDGPYDDVEPTWLPDGDIMFISSRCNRRVNCHTTQVGLLYRCRPDGGNIQMLSSNNEHDNTPWVLPNGQILYTRWEYVDRNQLSFHHLWITEPDGVRQTVFYGNMHPGITMIDAKPVPGSRKIVASFSPGHGQREHNGVITLVDPRNGPDDKGSAKSVSRASNFRDPWAFSEQAFMVARSAEIVLMNGSGEIQTVYRLPGDDVTAGLECHEPRPLCRREREPVTASSADWSRSTGRLLLVDVYRGRNMEGVRRGEIKKLLVLETLPKPMNYTGGAEPLSYGGTFTLERVLGTIPVETDGSAYAELPALRSLFFVALDENNLSVKRMQSFLTVMPGETTTCIGCHEQRTMTPPLVPTGFQACRRKPSQIEPISDVPDVLDFPRDIQPILDQYCVRCHDCENPEGGINLSGDRGPIFSLSYYTITAKNLVADGRNDMGNRPPRSIGSAASRLLTLMDGRHYDARPSEREKCMVRLWIETGAPYPGTYAALGTGMIGGFEIVDRLIWLDQTDTNWPSMKLSMETIRRRCCSCHDTKKPLPLSPSHLTGPDGYWAKTFRGMPPWIKMTPDDVRRCWSRDLFYNLTRPEKSSMLLAPLAKKAGGLESCGTAVFVDKADPDYQKILAAVRDAKEKLDQIKRFDMPGFQPRAEWVCEMKRYGILAENQPDNMIIDVYATERKYWESLWYRKNCAQ